MSKKPSAETELRRTKATLNRVEDELTLAHRALLSIEKDRDRYRMEIVKAATEPIEDQLTLIHLSMLEQEQATIAQLARLLAEIAPDSTMCDALRNAIKLIDRQAAEIVALQSEGKELER